MIEKTVSHFSLIRKIDEGGMGIIYEAEDINLNRKVALKFLAMGLLDSAEAKARFLQEARLVSRLDHANICTVYEVNETGDGQLFIAMAFYQGETLKALLERKTLSLKEVLDIMIQVVRGLEHAHQAGIVHRDLKPANIFITDKGEVKILDFGLARLENQAKITKTGTSIGTAAYMSPEQVEGRAGDQRMDIWSCGVLLFELLSRELPFKGDDLPSLLYAIVHNRPKAIEEINPGIPFALAKITEKCLQKKPEERFANATEICGMLAEIRKNTDKQQGSGRLNFLQRFSLFTGRLNKKKFIPITAIILAAALLVFFAVPYLGALLPGPAIPENMHIAVLPFQVEPADALLNDLNYGLVQTLSDKLELLEKFKPAYWVLEADQIYRSRAITPEKANIYWGVNIAVTGSLQLEKDKIRLHLKIINADSKQTLASRVYTELKSDLSFWQEKLLADILHLLDIQLNNEIQQTLSHGNTALPGAYGFFLLGCGKLHVLDKENEREQAITYFNEAVKQDPAYLWPYMKLAQAYLVKLGLTRDPVWLKEAEKNCMKAVELNTKLGNPYLILGDYYFTLRKMTDAIEAFNKSLLFNQDDFNAYGRLARAYRVTGQLVEVENSFKKMIETRPDFKGGYDLLAYYYYEKARYAEAIKMYAKITGLVPRNTTAYIQLGSLYAVVMDIDKAIAMFEKANSLEPGAYALTNLGTLYFYNGHYAKAISIFEQLLSEKAEQDNPELLMSVGECYRYVEGKAAQAETIFRKVIAVLEKKIREIKVDAIDLARLGLCYAYVGQFESARETIQKAYAQEPYNTDVIRESIRINEIMQRREKALEEVSNYLNRNGTLLYLEKEPGLTALREDAKYKELINNRKITL